MYIENRSYRLCRKRAVILLRNWWSSALNHLFVKTMRIITILYLIYNYREKNINTNGNKNSDFFWFLVFTFIEVIYEHTIVCSSISIRYKYKLPNQKAVVLINQSICHYMIDAKQMSNSLFTNFFTMLTEEIGKWYEIKSRKLLSQKIRCSCFLFN